MVNLMRDLGYDENDPEVVEARATAKREENLRALRTSVTRDQLADAIEGAHKEWHEYWNDFKAGIGDDPGPLTDFQADAVLTVLNGGTDV